MLEFGQYFVKKIQEEDVNSFQGHHRWSRRIKFHQKSSVKPRIQEKLQTPSPISNANV